MQSKLRTNFLQAENSEIIRQVRLLVSAIERRQASHEVKQEHDADSILARLRARALIATMALAPITAHADFESSLQGIVNFVITRIMPVIALYYFAEAIFFQLAHRPDAKDRIKSAIFGAIALFGVNGLWLWLKSQVR